MGMAFDSYRPRLELQLENWRIWTMADYKYECVNVRVRDGIAWAASNRPDKRNAMSPLASLRHG